MNTTAIMREKARFYESKLDWENAALCWDTAADIYPQPHHGALKEADLANIRRRAQSCRAQNEA